MEETFSDALIEFLEKWQEANEEEGTHARFYVGEAKEKLDAAFEKFVAAAVRKRMDGGGTN